MDPLHKAADSGYYEIVKIILERDYEGVYDASGKDLEAIHRAAGR
jgi:hypothetical protein